MASWFPIILDTTPPALSLSAPAWAVVGTEIFVQVTANEALDLGRQSARITDANGVEWPFALAWRSGAFTAYMNTWQFPPGALAITVTLWDEAGNSTTATKSLDLLTQATLGVTSSAHVRSTAVGGDVRPLEITARDGRLKVGAWDRQRVGIGAGVRLVQVDGDTRTVVIHAEVPS